MNFPLNKPAFILLALFLAVASISCSGSRAESNKNANSSEAAAPTIVDVAVATSVSRELPQYFEATGSLASDEQTDVAPTVGGKVVEVNFDVGSYVTKGSVLVRLDDRDARIRLEQAEAQVEQQQAAVRQAEENVRQTAARLGFAPGQTFNVENVAEVRSAQAALNLAEQELKRNERVLETGDISRSQYDQRRAQRDQARSAYEAALNTARQSYAAISTAQAAVTATRAGVESARTQVSAAQKAISDAIIRAPISGSIAERNADPGEFIGTNAKVATIVRTNPLRARIEVPEQDIANIRVGQSISLNTSAYPDRNFSGRVVRVLPNLNVQSRTLVAEAEVNNIEGLLRPGQFATVRVLLPQAHSAVMIPVNAVRQDDTSNQVFVVKEGRVEQRVVQLGQTESDLIEVKNGIRPDEKIAVSNLNLLYDGVQVRQ